MNRRSIKLYFLFSLCVFGILASGQNLESSKRMDVYNYSYCGLSDWYEWNCQKYVMTRYLFLFISVIIINTSKAQTDNSLFHNRTDSSLYKRINSLDLNKYKGKCINRLLKNEIIRSFLTKRYIDASRIGVLDAVILEYAENVNVYIEIKTFKHVNRIDKLRNWDFELLKKEKIKSIKVYIL